MYLRATATVIFVAALCCRSGRAQTGANCNAPCENYLSELQTVTQLYDVGVNTIGAALSDPTGSIQSMCNIEGNDIQTCYQCSHSNGLNSDLRLLNAWWETCVTYQQHNQDVESAYKCWRSVPNGSTDCYAVATNGSSGPNARGPYSSTWWYVITAIPSMAVFLLQ